MFPSKRKLAVVYSHYDQDVLAEFQSADWERRQELVEQFEDKRLIQLGRRLIVFYAKSSFVKRREKTAFTKSFVKTKWESTDQIRVGRRYVMFKMI